MIETAAQISKGCKEIIFIVGKNNQQNFKDYKQIFEIMDVDRMKKSEIIDLIFERKSIDDISEF